jgi:hypothetical protein
MKLALRSIYLIFLPKNMRKYEKIWEICENMGKYEKSVIKL